MASDFMRHLPHLASGSSVPRDGYAVKGSSYFRRRPFLMSWTYIVLGVAIVVLVLNIAVVFMLRSWGTGIGSNRESENH
jgi:hypothetical protein